MDNYEGKILLQGFEQKETERIKKLLDKYDKKLRRFSYQELRLTLQRHQKGEGKSHLNEIKGLMKLEKNLLHAEVTSHELFSAVDDVIKKLEKEAEHLIKLEIKNKGKER